MLSWHQFFKSADDACLLHYAHESVNITVHCDKGSLTVKQLQTLRKLVPGLDEVPIDGLRAAIALRSPLFIGTYMISEYVDIARQIDESGMTASLVFVTVEGFVPMDRRLGTQALLEDTTITARMVEQMKMANVPCFESNWDSPQMRLVKMVKCRDEAFNEIARTSRPSSN